MRRTCERVNKRTPKYTRSAHLYDHAEQCDIERGEREAIDGKKERSEGTYILESADTTVGAAEEDSDLQKVVADNSATDGIDGLEDDVTRRLERRLA